MKYDFLQIRRFFNPTLFTGKAPNMLVFSQYGYTAFDFLPVPAVFDRLEDMDIVRTEPVTGSPTITITGLAAGWKGQQV